MTLSLLSRGRNHGNMNQNSLDSFGAASANPLVPRDVKYDRER